MALLTPFPTRGRQRALFGQLNAPMRRPVRPDMHAPLPVISVDGVPSSGFDAAPIPTLYPNHRASACETPRIPPHSPEARRGRFGSAGPGCRPCRPVPRRRYRPRTAPVVAQRVSPNPCLRYSRRRYGRAAPTTTRLSDCDAVRSSRIPDPVVRMGRPAGTLLRDTRPPRSTDDARGHAGGFRRIRADPAFSRNSNRGEARSAHRFARRSPERVHRDVIR